MLGEGNSVTAGDRVEGELRRLIESGQVRPGDRLPPEPELLERFGVSRNTLREAIRALAGQGLLVLKRGVQGGTFVAAPTPDKISDSLRTALSLMTDTDHVSVAELVQVREMLEIPAAELAALNRTDAELEALRATLFDPYRVDPARVFGCTGGFHLGVLRATRNQLLPIVAEPVFRVLDERFLRARAKERVWLEVDRDHREILGFLERGDQAGAREATRAHLRAARSYYEGMDQS